MSEFYTFNKLEKIFDIKQHKTSFLKAEAENRIPKAERLPIGDTGRTQRGWRINDIPAIGEKYGWFKKPTEPMAIVVYSTKGGCLKSTTCLNISRISALHNIRTCVIGLDFQGDISNALGLSITDDTEEDLEEVDEKLNSILGLNDLFNGNATLDEIIQDTDIPTLKFIPETSEIQALNDGLQITNRREYWLKENVIDELKTKFDLIIIDCPPSWSLLTTNALNSLGEKDLLISPLETKINHYRNSKHYLGYLKAFKKQMNLKFNECFIPTKYTGTRKLSNQIKRFYMNTIENCSTVAIKESVASEESVASYLSLQEYAPNTQPAEEMKELLIEINDRYISKSVH
jgi:chromosome partitioning protein